MSTVELYRVEMRRKMEIKVANGPSKFEDVVEVFHDMTYEESLGLRKKFSNVEDITIYLTGGGSKRKPKKDYSVTIGTQQTRERTDAPVKNTKKAREKTVEIPAHDLAGLVNTMAAKEFQ